jgi:hypothetical protein
MVEIEISVLRSQCLDRRIDSKERLVSEIAAWERLRIPRQCGHRFRRKAATDSDRKRPPDPNEGGHPVDGVIRGALSAV